MGAQLIQRYAIIGNTPDTDGVEVHHWVGIPGAYVYFTNDRPVGDMLAGCPGYNNWHYGLVSVGISRRVHV